MDISNEQSTWPNISRLPRKTNDKLQKNDAGQSTMLISTLDDDDDNEDDANNNDNDKS